MTELLIQKQYGYCREIDVAIDKPELRVYRNDPKTISIQIRNNGPITDHRKGKNRNMISGLALTREEAIALIKGLNEFVKEIGQ